MSAEAAPPVRVRNRTAVKQAAGPHTIGPHDEATIPSDLLPLFGDAVEVIMGVDANAEIDLYRPHCQEGCGHSLCLISRKLQQAFAGQGITLNRHEPRPHHDRPRIDAREGAGTSLFCNAGTWEGPTGSWTWLHWDNDRAPREHVAYWQRQFDGNICVSQSVRQGMIAAGAPENRLRVIQNGIDTDLYQPDGETWEPPGTEGRFIFLVTGALSVRKGTDIALEAYGQAFSADDPVVLVLRNYSYGREEETQDFIAAWHQRRGADAPKVLYLYETWTDERMAAFYRRTAEHGALLQPHRVEGFGLCGLEAMACGCRLGTTGWSGPLEYADRTNSTLFGYKLGPSAFNLDLYQMDEQPQWAEPKLKDVVRWMKQVFATEPDTGRLREIATEVRERFTYERQAIEIAEVLGARPAAAMHTGLPDPLPDALPIVPGSLTAEAKATETIGVSIATRDRLEYLLMILGALLAQTRRPDEICIVNDSDAPYEKDSHAFSAMVLHYRRVGIPIHLLAGTGQGASPNHQRALERLETDLILRIDDDLVPACADFLERLARHIEGKSDVGAVGGSYPRSTEGRTRQYSAEKMMPGMTNRVDDMLQGQVGLQFRRWSDEALVPAEHLYSSYLYRRGALAAVGGFASCYSRFGQREETDASVRLHLLGGLKLLVDIQALAVHFEASGGRRPETSRENWTHDEQVFLQRYHTWLRARQEAGG
jgi:glycosyltransferase involved in cell wall biosynthesis/GT2 family glycosyltransferase